MSFLPSIAMPDPADFEAAKQQFFEGLDCYKAGRFGEAERLFLASLAHLPQRVSTLVNLAATQLELGCPQDALTTVEQALALEADKLDAWFQHGRALDALGHHAQALSSFEKALALDNRPAELWLRHGQTLQSLHRHEQALGSYDRALAADPGLAQAWSNRGGILRDTGRHTEAARAFEQALAHGAPAELHGYYLAAVGARPVPASAPKRYVQSLFDDYAAQFDDHLVGVLRYRAPAVLGRLLGAAIGDRRLRSALDLGCGTGLCGPVLARRCERLVGVDLSKAMLDKARTLGLYQQLVQADIVDHLRTTAEHFDAVLAADVFIYLGDLAPVFAAVRSRLHAGGVFCFSVEEAAPGPSGFELLPSLRYAHAENHLRALAETHGFDVAALTRETIREDQREAVEGLFVCLKVR